MMAFGKYEAQLITVTEVFDGTTPVVYATVTERFPQLKSLDMGIRSFCEAQYCGSPAWTATEEMIDAARTMSAEKVAEKARKAAAFEARFAAAQKEINSGPKVSYQGYGEDEGDKYYR